MSVIVVRLVDTVFTVYYWIMIARIVLSWVPQLANNTALRPLISFIYDITEPFLSLFRRLVPTLAVGGAGFDFSPLIAIITLVVLQSFVRYVLLSIL